MPYLESFTLATDNQEYNYLRGAYPGAGYQTSMGCYDQEATVRTGHGTTTDWFQIGKGVRQGCILSPCLFNLYAEYIM